MRQIPSKIYLQFHGQERSELPDTDLEQYNEQSEVTWCEDRINDTDVEYRRVERPRKQEEQTLIQAADEYCRYKGSGHFMTPEYVLDITDAFKAGAEWQKRQTPWISVKDKLPETDEDMYICLDTKMRPHGIGICEYNPLTKNFSDSIGTTVHPTYWMYIPKSPKGGKK